jgi:hypothetical protein
MTELSPTETWNTLTAPVNMADLDRSAKRVSHWTNNELLAFNIRVEDAGVEAFFNVPQLPTNGFYNNFG